MRTHAIPSPCAVGGAAGATPSYTGPIRRGIFGRFFKGMIFRCAGCGLEWLTADETLALEPGQRPGPLAESFDTLWRPTLESQGCSDYLYVLARTPGAAS